MNQLKFLLIVAITVCFQMVAFTRNHNSEWWDPDPQNNRSDARFYTNEDLQRLKEEKQRLIKLQQLFQLLIDNRIKRSAYDFTTTQTPMVHHSGGECGTSFDYYTGTLTTAFSLAPGIDLSYQATGITVEQIASWVGLGWQLYAGGIITRSVRGYPDDLKLEYWDNDCQCYVDYAGWIDTNIFDNTSSGSEIFNYDPEAEPEDRANALVDILGLHEVMYDFTKEDTEPDQFYFQFGNKSGSFIFDIAPDEDNGMVKALLIPYQNIRVSYTLDEETSQINSFTIVDDDGTTYKFEAYEEVYTNSVVDDNSREEVKFRNPPGTFINVDEYEGPYNQSWFLTKIITPANEEISFQYDEEKIRLEEGFYEAYRDFEDWEEHDEPICRILRNQEIEGSELPILNSYRLSKIISDYLEIDFIANDIREDLDTNGIGEAALYPRALNKINVYSKIGNEKKLIKQIEFYYSYFESGEDNFCGSTEYPTYYSYEEAPYGFFRLRLDSLRIFNGHELLPSYRFHYIKFNDEL